MTPILMGPLAVVAAEAAGLADAEEAALVAGLAAADEAADAAGLAEAEAAGLAALEAGAGDVETDALPPQDASRSAENTMVANFFMLSIIIQRGIPMNG
jgi:hypothetical protein